MIYPDCRVDENYNEDFLIEEDKLVIRGYDLACEIATDFILSNIEPEEILGVLGANKVVRSVFSTVKKYIHRELSRHLEASRDEIITSIIDNMDEDKYNEIREQALKDNPGKYKDSRELYSTSDDDEDEDNSEVSEESGEKDEGDTV